MIERMNEENQTFTLDYFRIRFQAVQVEGITNFIM